MASSWFAGATAEIRYNHSWNTWYSLPSSITSMTPEDPEVCRLCPSRREFRVASHTVQKSRLRLPCWGSWATCWQHRHATCWKNPSLRYAHTIANSNQWRPAYTVRTGQEKCSLNTATCHTNQLQNHTGTSWHYHFRHSVSTTSW